MKIEYKLKLLVVVNYYFVVKNLPIRALRDFLRIKTIIDKHFDYKYAISICQLIFASTAHLNSLWL